MCTPSFPTMDCRLDMLIQNILNIPSPTILTPIRAEISNLESPKKNGRTLPFPIIFLAHYRLQDKYFFLTSDFLVLTQSLLLILLPTISSLKCIPLSIIFHTPLTKSMYCTIRSALRNVQITQLSQYMLSLICISRSNLH